MKGLVVAVAALAAISGSAFAADLAAKAPPPLAAPAAGYPWGGCYLDGGAGYGMWNQDNNTQSPPGVPITADQTTGGRGWFGQVGGGCDYQFAVAGWGNFLIDALADYSFMNLHGKFDEQNTGDNGREKESSAWAVGVRLGYIVTPNLLTYINGGWTQTRFDQINLNTFQTDVPTADFIPATTYNGWFLSGGTETSLAGFFGLPSGFFLRSEYRFSTFSSKDVPVNGPGFTPTTPTSVHMTKYVQTISTALVWKFNWMGR